MGKILLFYKYFQVDEPQTLAKEQRKLCETLSLKGRILIGIEGINGTVGGTAEAIEQYKKAMLEDPRFADVDFKESDGGTEAFPKLRIVVRNEIVALGIAPQNLSAQQGGQHLSPEETHSLLNKKPKNLVILDTRNNYEWQIGTFKDSIKPPIENFRDLPKFIDDNIELFKDKEVLMHCTGGIRCERATAYLNTKGVAKKVYQIKGGIHRYIEKFPDGHFRGKLYVFDGRIAMKVNDDILATCCECKKPYDTYINCVNAQCNKQVIICPDCITYLKSTCSTTCKELVEKHQVNIRVKPNKTMDEVKPCKIKLNP